MNYLNVFVGSLEALFLQVFSFVPQLIMAILIWIVGKYLLNLFVNFVNKVDVKKFKPLQKLVDHFSFLIYPFGKVVLFLVILDYLGIGRTLISALVSSVTYALAIALGLAFGKALEDDAKKWYEDVKKELNK